MTNCREKIRRTALTGSFSNFDASFTAIIDPIGRKNSHNRPTSPRVWPTKLVARYVRKNAMEITSNLVALPRKAEISDLTHPTAISTTRGTPLQKANYTLFSNAYWNKFDIEKVNSLIS